MLFRRFNILMKEDSGVEIVLREVRNFVLGIEGRGLI